LQGAEWSTALQCAEIWTLQKADQKHMQNFEMWCWKKMEFSWTDYMRYKEMLQRVKEDSNILQKIKGRLPGLVTSCMKKCLLQHVTLGQIG
jgi:hypothetical protein